MKSFEEFRQQFRFNPRKKLLVGVEREAYLTDGDGQIVPLAVRVLDYLGGSRNGHFGYELSACQLEWRIGPCDLSDLKSKLLEDELLLGETERKLGFKRCFIELLKEERMPLDVYPDPTGRYAKIAKKLPEPVLLAACRAISTHFHIGMPDHETALNAYNLVIEHFDELCQLSGRCLDNYLIVVPQPRPPHYNSWKDFYDLAVKDNFTHDPRSCWHLIRMSIHGTIEFRMFGATTDPDEIVSWATACQNICAEATS